MQNDMVHVHVNLIRLKTVLYIYAVSMLFSPDNMYTFILYTTRSPDCICTKTKTTIGMQLYAPFTHSSIFNELTVGFA